MNIFSQTVGKRRTTVDIHNDCLAPDNFFDIGFVKTQQGRVLERRETEKHDCRKLMKSYKIVEYVYKVEELIEPTEEEYILTTYMEMVNLLKNGRKRKINDTKYEDLYVNYRFIFESAARAKKSFSHCK